MKTLSALILAAIVGIFTSSTVLAKDKEAAKPAKEKAEKAKKEKKKKPELTDVEVSGKLVKKERTAKNKDGEERTMTRYGIETENGLVRLPKSKDVDLDGFVDRAVVATGKGVVLTKGDKSRTILKKLTGIKGTD
jgi:hypothetical protein